MECPACNAGMDGHEFPAMGFCALQPPALLLIYGSLFETDFVVLHAWIGSPFKP
jgi:hypothetical protein